MNALIGAAYKRCASIKLQMRKTAAVTMEVQWLRIRAILALACLCMCRIIASQAEGSVRLQGGNSHLEGRVEIFTGGQWGVVGNEGWGEKEASVACKQLGFGGVQAVVASGYFPPSPLSLITSVECGGWEVSVGECGWGEVVTWGGGHLQKDTHIAGIVCADELSVRLSGESGDSVRMVEVWSGGGWRGVCEDRRGWGREESSVTCRQLGYLGDDLVTGSVTVDTGQGLWLWRQNCSGSEHHLRSCDLGGLMSHDQAAESCDLVQLTNCSSGRAVALNCGGVPASPPQSLRLVDATCSTLVLEWVEPRTGNHTQLIGYTVRFRSANEFQGQWQYTQNDTNETTFTVGTLNASMLYEIQVGVVYGKVGGVSGDESSANGDKNLNTIYSESLLATTQPAVLAVPVNLTVLESGPDSISLTWAASASCGITVADYEIVYSDLNASNATFSCDTVSLPRPHSDVSVSHTVHGLSPYTWYGLRVRSIGEWEHENGTRVASGFSNTVNVQTSEGVPSSPPPSFSAFLDQLQLSVTFQWQPIPIAARNGDITRHTLYCSLYNRTTGLATVVKQLSATALSHVQDLQSWTEYSCRLTASTSEGEGPHSALINFTTSPDVGNAPSPPADVQFTVSSSTDTHSQSIAAKWSVPDCRQDSSCNEPQGYIVTCCVPGSELSTTVWKSDTEKMDLIQVKITGVSPATRYVCKVAAFNMYGVGNTGSNIFVDTPESVPRTAPTQVYSSDIQTDSIRLNWNYEETPSPGDVNTFKIETYIKDNRYPSRDGEHVDVILYTIAETDKKSVTFSYLLTYLDPGTTYNLLIRAVTVTGEGPAARIGQQTLSTVPTVVPSDLTGSILSYTHSQPPSFYFQWVVQNTDRHLLHDITGFITTCSANKTTTTSDTRNDVITISEPYFIEGDVSVLTDFSTVLNFPDTCGSDVAEVVSCSVAAFNRRGRGEDSEAMVLTLPCHSDPEGPLESTFLTNPHSSLGILAALVLLVLGVMVAIAVLCVCNQCGTHGKTLHKHLSSSSSIDGNYVPMASSEAGIKPRWSDTHTSQVTAPCSSLVGVAPDAVGDPAYDEIPADRLDNLYDEIHPHSCRGVPTLTQETKNSGVGHGDSGQTGSLARQHHTDPKTVPPHISSLGCLQVIPLSSSRSEARDSTITQYMEISSPVLGAGDDTTGGNITRYSVADSGVNMTSSDVERGLNLDLPQNDDMEDMQIRHYPECTTDITLSDAHHNARLDPNESKYYTTMLPYSMLGKNQDYLEWSVDTQLIEDASESGLGIESEVSNSDTCPNSMHNMESNQTVVVATRRGRSNGKKNASQRVREDDKKEQREGERERGRGGSKASSEDEDQSGDECKDKDKQT